MLRGGAFKPRTSPFAFKGLGVAGLEILSEARAETGLPVVSELLDAQYADVMHEHADVLQIGARNMQNYASARGGGQARQAGAAQARTLVEPRRAAAGRRLRPQGGQRAGDALRARASGRSRRRRASRSTSAPCRGSSCTRTCRHRRPVALRPGDRRLVEPLSRAAAAVGADGLLVEVHQDPEHAICDGPQALEASGSRASPPTSPRTRSWRASGWPEAPPLRSPLR
jgi:3-deoxy-7-phosphoheptulonate synthase